ncbi:hypothetical protein BDN70DRAFT_880130 [Pholiota conissans]|uniref:ADF-H domain-containing protein n=1 Tax=Pholiota conissans TaxID=109636 RepID=A0A9P6CZB7_9AGAR|nr:hypothetical protein BDN70DRAFT_880130 [Pholiota conissans]
MTDSFDEIGIHSYGMDGLEELKTKLSDDDVFIAFYREELDVDPGYILINYIPPSISGVKRARTLVHSRRVGAIFKKHQTIFTVDSISLLTTDNIHRAIVNPESAFPAPSHSASSSQQLSDRPPQEQRDTYKLDSVQRALPPLQPVRLNQDQRDTQSPLAPLRPVRAQSQEQHDNHTSQPSLPPLQPVRPQNNRASPPKPIVPDMARRSFTATYVPEMQPPTTIPPLPPLPKGGSMFTNLLRRKKRTDDSYDDMDDVPPPTPPKDKGVHQVTQSYSLPSGSSTRNQPLRHHRSRSLSDYAVISHVRGSDEVFIEPERKYEPYQAFSLRPSGKWSNELPHDPEERARRRREAQLHREREEQEAIEEEAQRQRQLKLQKEEFEKQEKEEEGRRKVEVEREIRRITAERRRREMLEKEEEERKRQELEERKRIDRERRVEEHRRLEEWRKEQVRRGEIVARQAEETKRREEAERTKKIQQAAAKLKRAKEDSDLTGWITIQTADSLSWKRRFYKFVGNTVYLYRSPKDLTLFEEANLEGQVRGLKEWNEGYDELEAIAFSFVVEFKDDRLHWAMFADSEEEKYKILGLFKIAAGL